MGVEPTTIQHGVALVVAWPDPDLFADVAVGDSATVTVRDMLDKVIGVAAVARAAVGLAAHSLGWTEDEVLEVIGAKAAEYA